MSKITEGIVTVDAEEVEKLSNIIGGDKRIEANAFHIETEDDIMQFTGDGDTGVVMTLE